MQKELIRVAVYMTPACNPVRERSVLSRAAVVVCWHKKNSTDECERVAQVSVRETF